MTKSETSFKGDFEELTSPKNFVKFIGWVVPFIMVILINKEKFLLTFFIILGIIFLLILLYFFVRWVFLYRGNKKEDKKTNVTHRKPHIYASGGNRKEDQFKHIKELLGDY